MEIARRQALKEQKKKEKEAKMIKPSQLDTEQKEEEELPPIYIPDPPSPLYCGFYSQPNQFWLSMVHTADKAMHLVPQHKETILQMRLNSPILCKNWKMGVWVTCDVYDTNQMLRYSNCNSFSLSN